MFIWSRTLTGGCAFVAAPALVALVLFAGCDGDETSSVSDKPSSEVRTTVATATPEPPTQTPLVLQLTPQPVAYEIEDPSFEPLPGARALFGTHEGAAYKIEVPERWNGSLVLYAHGYRGYAPGLVVDAPYLRTHFIENGYAWAASSYSANGYAVGAGVEDTRKLIALFTDLVGEPERTYLYGSSMGGHITTYLMEHYPADFDGALAECGAVAGAGVLDYFLAWTVVAAHVTDVPEALTGDPEVYLAAIAEINARLGPADSPTIEGRQFESIMSEFTGGDRPFRHEGFAQARAWNFLIIHDALQFPEESLASASNRSTVYGIEDGLGLTAAELNAGVPRVAPADTADANQRRYFAPVTGEIERPYLLISNTGDFLVPISQAQIYGRAVEAAGRGDLLVQRAVRRPGHCNFTSSERVAAFEALVAWVEEGARPVGEDLSADLADVGVAFTDPLMPDDPGVT